ncbi:ferric-dicitrate binding protein FerR, regulates iron transport through sigma-19 [Chitinophaga eiseniae]|uniref:Ferric-dicitrate binding protein FerR, regulates iron transport through sigma-19 n=2 Tax=Chitinophaga eiseniae TaxID=634771 RepID=A0A1T4QJL0_9BACT|nr:ferric-dicitrate binding protein FerR, regulates iron transport through sigma-19 [Chitinophaga eiseniae]
MNKYLDHRCTAEEKLRIAAFMQQREGQQLLDEVLTERLTADMLLMEQIRVDDQQAEEWKTTLRQRIAAMQPEQEPVVLRPKRLAFLRRAAIWTLLVSALGTIGVHQYRKQYKTNAITLANLEKQNPKGRRAVITLADGSVIHLGADSKLEYPEVFNGPTREITLTGEAFFEISEDPTHPFIVHTGTVQTRVLGTSFKINAFKGTPLTVAVATGKVQVEHAGNGVTVLAPGQQVTWDPVAQQTAIAEMPVADIAGWKNARLAFNNNTLQEVAAVLERWYNVSIRFKQPVTAQKRITVTLSANRPMEETLRVLSTGSRFTYKINNRQITIH